MIKTIEIPTTITRIAEVKYYVEADPNIDLHFQYEEPFIYKNMLFDTLKEAQKHLKEWETQTCCILKVKEKIINIF